MRARHTDRRRIYVILSENCGTKIGVSADPASRAVTLGKEGGGRCRVHFQTDPHRNAFLIEKLAHHALASRKLRGEWFDISVDEAVAAVREAVGQVVSGDLPEWVLAHPDGRSYRASIRTQAAGMVTLCLRVPVEMVDEFKERAALARKSVADIDPQARRNADLLAKQQEARAAAREKKQLERARADEERRTAIEELSTRPGRIGKATIHSLRAAERMRKLRARRKVASTPVVELVTRKEPTQ